jgi:putative ABC transport system substrate-binding protein
MRRRAFIALMGGAVVASPLATRAQQPAMPVIGFLNTRSADDVPELTAAFRKGLNEIGYMEGRNTAIEYRWANNDPKRLPELASDLVRRQVTVIVATGGNVSALAAKAATGTIPIVFSVGADPIKLGLVTKLNRPDKNATGVTVLTGLLGAKRLELLRELIPKANVVAVLINSTNPSAEIYVRETREAAHTVGQQIHTLSASNEVEIDAAFAALAQVRAEALLVVTDAVFIGRREQIVTLAARYAVPAIYEASVFAKVGGLMSYGPSFAEALRQVGIYAGRILKGEKPADLPVLQPTKFELVINLKTAKGLGLTVPHSLLVRADEVIE